MTPHELALVLASAILHATWSVAIKHSRNPLAFNVLQVGFDVAAAAAVLLWIPLRAVPLDVWAVLAATGVAHGLYFYWLTRAYETADLSLVYPIARSTPAFLPLVAAVLLGESLSAGGVLGIAIVVAGIWSVLASRMPGWRGLASPGARFAYLTLAATVAYSLLDKHAMARLGESPWSSEVPRSVAFFFLLALGNALVFVPLALRRLRTGAIRELARLEGRRALGAAALSFASYTLILEALRTAPVSYVVAVRQTSVIFALALAVVWLRERPDRVRVLGALAIAGGVALIAFSP